MFACGILRVCETVVPSRWHCPQSFGTSTVDVGDPAVDGRFTVCVPWHVLHCGASLSPRADAFPWRLAAYCACWSGWQVAQSTGASLSACGSFFGSTSL